MKNLKKIIQIFYLLVGMFLLIQIIQFIKKYQKIISWLIKIFQISKDYKLVDKNISFMNKDWENALETDHPYS